MTLSHIGTGAVSAGGGVATNPTTVAPAFPGGYSVVAGDLAVVTVTTAHDTEATPTITSGWDQFPGLSASGGGGSFGAGTGPRRLTWFLRVLQAGDTAPTVSLAGTNTGRAIEACITILRRDAGTGWLAVAAFGAITTQATNWSGSTSTNPGIESGDLCLLGYAVRDDQPAAFSAMGVSATGATFGTVTERADSFTANGNDLGLGVATVPVTAGSASAAPVVTATIGSQETGEFGVLRVRENIPDTTAPIFEGVQVEMTPSSANNTVTSGSFTPPANVLLVATIWSDNDTRGTISDSVGTENGGDWFELVGRDVIEAGAQEAAVVMYGKKIGASPSARTVTFTRGNAGETTTIGGHVEAWSNYDTADPVGATGEGDFASGSADPKTVNLTTQEANSWVLGAIVNWDHSTIATGDGGTTVVTEWSEQASGNTCGGGSFRRSAKTASASTSVTLSVNRSPNAERGHIVAFELKADAGAPPVEGSGAGAFGGLGVSTGVPRSVGAAVGSFGGLGVSTGTRRRLGVATGDFGGLGVSTGVPRPQGSAVGAFGGLGVSTGLPRSVGAAVGTWGFTGTATGTAEAPPAEGSGVGDFGGLGTATGVPRPVGVAAADFGGLGVATGQPTTLGSATGDFGGLGSAAGVPRSVGAAVAAFGGLGTGTGTARVVGSGVGDFGGLGTAQGTTAGTVLGAGAGAFGGLGTAAGQKTVLGVAAGSWGFLGQSTGQPFLEGAAAGPWGGLGAAQGVRRVVGAAVGSWGFLAVAEVPPDAIPGHGSAYVGGPGGIAYVSGPGGRAYVDRTKGKVAVG